MSKIIIALVIAVLGVGGFFVYRNMNKLVTNTPTQSKSSPSPSDTTNINAATHNFPIYPGSTFLKKEETAPCPKEVSGYSDCGSIAYRWVVNEDAEKVQNWYGKDNMDKLGWELKGGAGSAGSFSTQTWVERNSNFRLALQISSNTTVDTPNPAYKTTVSVLLPSEGNPVALSPIFSYLSKWVPNATWEAPQQTTNDTPYGKATGMEAKGKMTGGGGSLERNFEDEKVMSSLGFGSEDIQFAADGPGASNWGYSKTENGQTQVVVFSYSSNRLLGPESTSPPYTNLSVFVSDPFTKK